MQKLPTVIEINDHKPRLPSNKKVDLVLIANIVLGMVALGLLIFLVVLWLKTIHPEWFLILKGI